MSRDEKPDLVEPEPGLPGSRATGEDVTTEQEFLLRSLDDLDAERAAGNIDDSTFERLHSDYTARAAAALRAAGGRTTAGSAKAGSAKAGSAKAGSSTGAPPMSAKRRAVTVVGIVAFATVVGLVMASALGTRLSGQTSSGNTVSEADREDTLRAAIAEAPDDPQARLALARFLMARQRFPDAFAEFSQAATLDPTLAEAHAYGGWLLYLADEPARARLSLEAAIAADEAYPDAHFFLGLVALRGEQDPARAVPELQRYLTLVPSGAQSDQVRTLLAEAVAAIEVDPSP